MASIGSITCTFVRGHIPGFGQASEQWHVAGIDGDGIAILGQTAEPFELTAVLHSSTIGLMTALGQMQALQGQIVTVTNDWGQSFRLFLRQVKQAKPRAARIPGTILTQMAEVGLTCVMVPQ